MFPEVFGDLYRNRVDVGGNTGDRQRHLLRFLPAHDAPDALRTASRQPGDPGRQSPEYEPATGTLWSVAVITHSYANNTAGNKEPGRRGLEGRKLRDSGGSP